MTSDPANTARAALTVRTLLIAGTACAALAACNTYRDGPNRDVAASPAAMPALEKEVAAAQPYAVTVEMSEDRQRATLPPAAAGNEDYADTAPNPVKSVAEAPVSTFSVDVDTAAYANIRRFLTGGQLPPKDAVRVEEMINYFDYAYALPGSSHQPFAANVAVMPTPWNPNTKLLHIGLKGYDIPRQERPRANLVFLIDVSGSMAPPDKLPLLKQSLKMMVNDLRDDDMVAGVTYAGTAGVLLEPTPGRDRAKILAAIDSLTSGGSTAGAAGLQTAYDLAQQSFDKEAVNRVILATDGDFNVGMTDPAQLESFITEKRKSGVYLSVLGFGTGNLNDLLMQKLAQTGNGNAAYIDSLLEARKALVDEMAGNLFPIADDVKIQVEFNPKQIAEYRLIGYETRALNREDFANDQVDAGEIGSGHEVTAIYEITPVGSAAALLEPLRYSEETAAPKDSRNGEIAFLRLRYKLPGEATSRLIERPITGRDTYSAIVQAPAETRFAVAVAAFGQLLRGDPYLKAFGYDQVIALAQPARGDDPFGYRAEFVQLVRLAGGTPVAAAE
jgi:Ca-activated chloride channel family protein